MPQRMTIFVTAILVIVVSAVSLTARTSIAQRADDECITKPNATPPQGSHWYYRLDRATRKQCWYLGPVGEKVRTRQIASRTKSSAPKQTPQPTAKTIDETTAAEAAPAKTAPAKTASAETASAPTIPDEAPASVDDPAVAFAMRWPAGSKSDRLSERGRASASASHSYADEHSTTDPLDGAPLAWPIATPADPATGRTPESAIRPERMLALLAGALGLAAILLGAVFNPPRGRSVPQPRIRKRWWWASNKDLSDDVDPEFGDPLAAARRVDLASKPARIREPHKSSAPKSTAPKSSAPKSGSPERSDAGHDLEASLQQLLRDWKRAAA
jgi:hypothetical protein